MLVVHMNAGTDYVAIKRDGCHDYMYYVLAGAGGCVRLPRLIGLRQALPLLVSGQSVDGKKALKLGIVDQLFSRTQTLSKSSASGHCGGYYDYQWLAGLLACIEQEKIGKRSFLVQKRETDATAVSSVVDASLESPDFGIDSMMSSLAEEWEKCEKKTETKYPWKAGFFRSSWDFLLNALFCTVTLFQLWRKVGLRMPAPYQCLLTTLRCLYAGSWRQAMSINAHGMACLIANAESTAIMLLFLITRKLKKLAMGFGLKASENAVPYNQLGCTVFVYVSSELLSFSLPFVQGLLYSGIEANVVIADKITKKPAVFKQIRDHFAYALKRHYISGKEVEEKIRLLSVCDLAEVAECVKKVDCEPVIVVNASTREFSMEDITHHCSEVIGGRAPH